MESQKLLLFILSILYILHSSTCTNLISKYQSSQTYIDSIIGDLQNSEKSWNLTSIKLADRNWDNSGVQLSLANFNCTSNTLSADGLLGILHRNKYNKLSSVEIYSSNAIDLILQFKFEFYYELNKTLSDGTLESKSGSGWMEIASSEVHYDKIFTASEYKVITIIDLKLKFIGHKLDEFDEEVTSMIEAEMKDDSLGDATREVTDMIKESLIEYNTITEQDKQFSISIKDHHKNYSVSYKVTDQSYLNDEGDMLITFMDGLIIDQEETIEADPQIIEHIDFNTTTCSKSSEQLFIHNKLPIDLFKLNYEKKLFTIDQEKINLMNYKDLYNRMNMKWISKYYPGILDFKPIDAEFFFELYVNYVNWNSTTGDAMVKYTFYFLSTDDTDLLIEFDVYLSVSLSVVETENDDGTKGINYAIRDRENLSFEKFLLLVPKIGVRFDSKNFYKFIEDFLDAYYKFDNYMLFRSEESFKSLIESFNTVENVESGVIVCNRNESGFKFLGE